MSGPKRGRRLVQPGLLTAALAFNDAGWDAVDTTWGQRHAGRPIAPLDVIRIGMIRPVAIGFQSEGWSMDDDALHQGEVCTVLKVVTDNTRPSKASLRSMATWHRVTLRRECDDRIFVVECCNDDNVTVLTAITADAPKQLNITTHFTPDEVRPGIATATNMDVGTHCSKGADGNWFVEDPARATHVCVWLGPPPSIGQLLKSVGGSGVWQRNINVQPVKPSQTFASIDRTFTGTSSNALRVNDFAVRDPSSRTWVRCTPDLATGIVIAIQKDIGGVQALDLRAIRDANDRFNHCTRCGMHGHSHATCSYAPPIRRVTAAAALAAANGDLGVENAWKGTANVIGSGYPGDGRPK